MLIFLVEDPLHTCYLSQCPKLESSELAVFLNGTFVKQIERKREINSLLTKIGSNNYIDIG